MEFRIRKADLEDAEAIAGVHVASWQTLYRGIISQNHLDSLTVLESRSRWDQNLSKASDDYIVFVVEHDAGIVGFANIGLAQEAARENEAELYAIYLHPDYHGQGVGSKLFRACLDQVRGRGCKKFFCWVIKDHDAGHEFYKYMGGKLISNSEKNLTIGGFPYAIVSYGWAV